MATLFTQATVNKALDTRCRIAKIDDNHYRVTPQTAGHGVYVLAVTFDKKGLPTVEACRDSKTKKQCKGFRFNDGCCYHGAALSIHLIQPLMKAA